MVRDQIEQAKADIRQAGSYTVDFRAEFAIKDVNDQTRFLCTSMVLARAGSTQLFDSHLCLGVLQNKFLKLRISVNQHPNSDQEARTLAIAWTNLLWPVTRPSEERAASDGGVISRHASPNPP